MKKKSGLIAAVLICSASMSMTAFAAGWSQDTNGWSFTKEDGTRAVSEWMWIDGNGDYVSEDYYFDQNGYLLTDTTTPDGYTVDSNGAWIMDGTVQTKADIAPEKIFRATDKEGFVGIGYNETNHPKYVREVHNGLECHVIDPGVTEFGVSGMSSNITTDGHVIWLYGLKHSADTKSWSIVGNPVKYDLEYDKNLSLDFTGNGLSADEFATYCIDNDIVMRVCVYDTLSTGEDAQTSRIAYVCYAGAGSTKTGEIAK